MEQEISLTQALKQGHFEQARELLNSGHQLPENLSDYERTAVLDSLVRSKAFDLILLLMENGFIERDIYEYDSFRGSIFESLFKYLAADEDSLSFLEQFTGKLQSLSSEVQDQTLLGLALEHGTDLRFIKCLVQAGCSLDYKNNAEENYLYQVVNNHSLSLRNIDKGLEYLKYLVDQGLEVNQGNIVGTTPLQMAIDRNKKPYVDFLLENGADPNASDRAGKSPFYAAVVHQFNLELYEKLARYSSVDFEATSAEGEALLPAYMRMLDRAGETELKLLARLLEDGGDPYQTAHHYGKAKSVLDWAAEKSLDVLKTVVEKGNVEINRQDDQGNTVLHKVCAVQVNYDKEAAKELYRKAKFLLEQGADANLQNDKDQSALNLASDDNLKSKTVELLMQQ
jgi:ankyrin repeat protein